MFVPCPDTGISWCAAHIVVVLLAHSVVLFVCSHMICCLLAVRAGGEEGAAGAETERDSQAAGERESSDHSLPCFTG